MRARPVADAPVDALVRAADDVARDWLVVLVQAAPLAEAARLPIDALAREAPALIVLVARALADDAALGELERSPLPARTGALAGARDPVAVIAAVEALRAVLWRALVEHLHRPDPAVVASLADRLGAVTAELVAAGLRTEGPARREHQPAPPTPSGPPQPPPAPDLEDEPFAQDAGFAAQDTRGEREDAAYRNAEALLEPAVAEHARHGRPFALLVVALDGIDRMLAAQAGQEVVEAVAAAETSILALLRPEDRAVHEGTGQWWIVLPDAGRATARALALRLRTTVARAGVHRGAPLVASTGIAACPQDGVDVQELAEAAEDALLAARASGG